MRFLLIAALALCCSACAYQTRNTPADVPWYSSRLSHEKAVYVAMPDDGRYGAAAYHFSGRLLTQLLENAFQRHVNRVIMSTDIVPLEQALDAARQAGAGYLVFPAVLSWEHRDRGWGLARKTSDIKLLVLDTETRHVLDSTIIEGMAIVPFASSDNPRGLLPGPIALWTQGLYYGREQATPPAAGAEKF